MRRAARAPTTLTQYDPSRSVLINGLARPYPNFLVEHWVRIEPITIKTVAFVGVQAPNGLFTPVGTAFFALWEVGDVSYAFAVTAAHVIDNLSDASKSRVGLRVNKKNGEPAEFIQLDIAHGIRHPDAANDLLMFAVYLDAAIFDIAAIPISRDKMAANSEGTSGTMEGDHICAIGLYTTHYGSTANIPVVRTGNIAALPREPIWTKRGFIDAYLIELRTIAGLSGSPVFQTVLPVRIRDGKPEFRKGDNPKCSLIGMLLGYHAVQYKEDQIEVPRFAPQETKDASADASELSTDERNTGFGVAIPIERLIEIFEAPEFGQRVVQFGNYTNVEFRET